MRKLLAAGFATALAAILLAGSPASADAAKAQGNVTVFSTEFTELDVWENPSGCQKLPIAAHVLVNQTDQPVEIYGDPLCLTPSLTVQPGFGSHVAPGSGSFSADA
ncbi:MAG TPA: hypothetical protein VHH15_18775 [Actinophytocola sp.]|nr:hypothetical protein [Actinophytocola sp.]